LVLSTTGQQPKEATMKHLILGLTLIILAIIASFVANIPGLSEHWAGIGGLSSFVCTFIGGIELLNFLDFFVLRENGKEKKKTRKKFQELLDVGENDR
jgi:hypothetical protein